MARIARTDPITGETIFRTAPETHPLVHAETLTLTVSRKRLIADGEASVTLRLQYRTRSRARVERQREAVVAINGTRYLSQLDQQGMAEVTISAMQPGDMHIQALEPAGDSVFISVQAPPIPEIPPERLGSTFIFTGE